MMFAHALDAQTLNRLMLCIFIFASLQLIGLYVCLSDCLSVRLSICLSVCLFACLSYCLSVYLCVHLYMSVFLSICLSARPFVCPSVCLSVCLYITMTGYPSLSTPNLLLKMVESGSIQNIGRRWTSTWITTDMWAPMLYGYNEYWRLSPLLLGLLS